MWVLWRDFWTDSKWGEMNAVVDSPWGVEQGECSFCWPLKPTANWLFWTSCCGLPRFVSYAVWKINTDAITNTEKASSLVQRVISAMLPSLSLSLTSSLVWSCYIILSSVSPDWSSWSNTIISMMHIVCIKIRGLMCECRRKWGMIPGCYLCFTEH